MPRSASPAGADPESGGRATESRSRRNAEETTDSRRDSRRGGDRIVFDGHQRDSEAGGKSLDDRIRSHQAERRQRDDDRRRRDGSPDRRPRRPERRQDDDRDALPVRGMYSDRGSRQDRGGHGDRRGGGRDRYERRGSPDGNYRDRDRDRRDVRENGRGRDRGAPSRAAEANGVRDDSRAMEPAAAEKPPAAEKPAGKAGGVYIPPFKLAQMLREAKDETSAQYQRLRWDALRKSLNGLINKVNKENIKAVLPEIFGENLERGRGLFCRSLMKSQMASPTFTPIFAALVSVVNTKFPEIGELLLHRLILQFKRSFKRNDKPICSAVSQFLAHLINQQVADDMLAFEVAILLLDNPSEDSVEIALAFFKACGAYLQDVNNSGYQSILTRMRVVISEGVLEKRTALLIQNFLEQVAGGGREAGGQLEKLGYAPVPEGLDLIESGEQITHQVSLEESYNPQIGLDVFKEDPNFQETEKKYEAIKREILGEDDEDDDDEDDDGDEDDDEDDESEEEGAGQAPGAAPTQRIQDNTETNLINLRRTIYLTIMSGLTFEETGHKLMKIELAPGQEFEVASMILECCSQEKTFSKYHALLATRFALKFPAYQECFEECFRRQYSLIHRLETNKLRNVAKFFGALLEQDAISWQVLESIRLTQDDTTSSSRIFIKILFQELSENMGLIKLNQRLQDPELAPWFANIFPRDNPKNMRFSINFFTSIGLGGLTDALREHLAALPKILAEQRAAQAAAQQGSSDSSSSDDSDSSDDSSDSGSSSGSGSGSDGSSSSSADSSSSDDDADKTKKGKGASEAAKPASRKEAPAPELPARASRRGDAAEPGRRSGREDADRERQGRQHSPPGQHRAPQADSRRDREQERKRGRDDGAPSENGHTRKRRTAEEPDAPRSRKDGKQAPSRKHRNDSRESSHERWVGGNASPVDVNDRWAG